MEAPLREVTTKRIAIIRPYEWWLLGYTLFLTTDKVRNGGRKKQGENAYGGPSEGGS
jgi:hypothetical protein